MAHARQAGNNGKVSIVQLRPPERGAPQVSLNEWGWPMGQATPPDAGSAAAGAGVEAEPPPDEEPPDEEPPDDEEPLSVISTNMLKWPCQFGPRFDPILNQRFFSPLKMSHYHLLTRINLTSARHKWPIINRLLPMGFGFEICVIAIRILNDPNNVQQVSEWIVKNQEKELRFRF